MESEAEKIQNLGQELSRRVREKFVDKVISPRCKQPKPEVIKRLDEKVIRL